MASGVNILDGSMSVKDLVLNKSSQYGNSYASFKSELEYLLQCKLIEFTAL